MEAARIAVAYRTPVILLSDTFLANSSEPWPIPDVDSLPTIDPDFATGPNAGQEFLPYLRNERLARPWAVPGTRGTRHRIGGLEKEDGTGDISYDPENHERMTHLRAAKVAKVADEVPALEVDDPDGGAELLVLGWGSTYGAIRACAGRLRAAGRRVATAHLMHLNPFPANIGEVLGRYPKVLIPEANLGQLALLVRGRYLVDARSYNQVQGLPIHLDELEAEMLKVMDG
jgi:2-oxoglutarate ferredoxin oxidoreductase subunit alpha